MRPPNAHSARLSQVMPSKDSSRVRGKAAPSASSMRRGNAGRAVRAHGLDPLGRHGGEKPLGLDPGGEIAETALEPVLRGAIEQGREPAEAVDLHVDPRGMEHGQAEPREDDHEQQDGHGHGPSGSCPGSSGQGRVLEEYRRFMGMGSFDLDFEPDADKMRDGVQAPHAPPRSFRAAAGPAKR